MMYSTPRKRTRGSQRGPEYRCIVYVMLHSSRPNHSIGGSSRRFVNRCIPDDRLNARPSTGEVPVRVAFHWNPYYNMYIPSTTYYYYQKTTLINPAP